MVWTDEGMQIDWSVEYEKAHSPNTETPQLDANVTDKTESHRLKEPVRIDLILLKIVTSRSFPR
jgi:hypothetical protein